LKKRFLQEETYLKEPSKASATFPVFSSPQRIGVWHAAYGRGVGRVAEPGTGASEDRCVDATA